jgi:photosystem II stability/assembly factor-like uncharacterized protein
VLPKGKGIRASRQGQKPRRLRFLSLALLAVFSAGPAMLSAGENVWTSLGSQSGAVTSLAIDPQESGTVYGANAAGLFKSADGGTTWSVVKPGPPCCILTLLVDPRPNRARPRRAQEPTTLLAVVGTAGAPTGCRILRSTDGGVNWSPADSGLPIDASGGCGVSSLAVGLQNPTTLYAGNALAGGGVFKSADGGESWNAASAGLPASAVMALAVAPQNTDTVYASTLNSGLFRSGDGGASWNEVNSGLEADIPSGEDYISVLAIDPKDTNTVYAARHSYVCDDCYAEYSLFKTTDAGTTWMGMGTAYVITLAADPRYPGTIYAGTLSGILKSTDAAASWLPVESRLMTDPGGALIVPALAIDPQDPDTVFAAGTYAGIFKTTDAGASWNVVNSDLKATSLTSVLALRADSRNPGTIYAGTDTGVFKSTDAGSNWFGVNAGLPSPTLSALEMDAQSSVLYLVDGCCQDTYKSTDGGASWTPGLGRDANGIVVRGARLNTNALAVDPQNSSTLYVAGSYIQSGQPSGGAGVIKSTDGGATWSVMSSGLPTVANQEVLMTSIAIDPRNSGAVYAGAWQQKLGAGGPGVFKTTNGGGSWQNSGLTEFIRADVLAVDPQNSNTVYARGTNYSSSLRSSSLYKTTDGGTSWKLANTGLPDYINVLAIDPQNSNVLYAGSDSGVFRSPDGGASWVAVNSGLTSLSVTALAIDPYNDSTVYAGTASGAFAITLVPAPE